MPRRFNPLHFTRSIDTKTKKQSEKDSNLSPCSSTASILIKFTQSTSIMPHHPPSSCLVSLKTKQNEKLLFQWECSKERERQKTRKFFFELVKPARSGDCFKLASIQSSPFSPRPRMMRKMEKKKGKKFILFFRLGYPLRRWLDCNFDCLINCPGVLMPVSTVPFSSEQADERTLS